MTSIPAIDRDVQSALVYLNQHSQDVVTLEQLARAVGLSAHYLQRKFKAQLGMSPREYGAKLKLSSFREELQAGQAVSEATYAAGYGSSRALYESARASLGMTPAQVARKGAGLKIVYALHRCALGRALMGATEDGVCAVYLGDDRRETDVELERELQLQFAAADCTRGKLPHDWEKGILEHLRDTRAPLGVPLDFRGTPFQVRVWKALREIPAGERRTYSELAASIGSPKAVRAVGSACGQNAIAVLIPCHRVTRKDGGLGGYRWGLERKRTLLANEIKSSE